MKDLKFASGIAATGLLAAALFITVRAQSDEKPFDAAAY